MSKKFTITFAGDTSLGEWYVRKPGNEAIIERLDKKPFSFFEGVKPLVEGSNHFIINLETVLSDNPSNFLEGKEYPNWDHPTRMLDILCKLRVTGVNLANNHSMDFGPEVMLYTKSILEAAEIKVFGAGKDSGEASQPLALKLEGERSTKNVFVFAGMSAGRRYREEYHFFAEQDKPGINSLNQTMCEAISYIRKKDSTAMIIVCPHWQGLDYKWASEKSLVQDKGRAFIEAGADYVFGHGPHMINDIEKYQNGTIAYSIGNFVFNSPGRYKKLNAPPYSLVVRLEIMENNGEWSAVPHFYPIMTDNRRTNYKAVPLKNKRTQNLIMTLNDRASENELEAIYEPGKDEIGAYITVINKSTPPPSLEHSEVMDIVTGKKDISEVDLDDPDVIKRHVDELKTIHSTIDSNFREYYDRLSRSTVVRKNEAKSLEKLSKIVKKEYITHGMVRKFERKKLSIRKAISFTDIMIEKAELHRMGYSEYSWKLDEKTNAYKFADKIGLRRPKTEERTYTFEEIQKPDSPVVVKPIRSTGSMGVYLVFSENKILSAREGVYLNSWEECEKDARKKLEAGRSGRNPLLRTDKWMIEELVLSSKESIIPPNDLKFYCFYGEVLLVLEANRAQYNKFCFWDAEMNLVKTGKYEGKNQFFQDGLGFTQNDLDIAISASLQIPVPFIRLDMLKGYDGLVFGEATPRPGKFHLFNDQYDRKLGEAYRRAEARLLKDLLNGKKFAEFTDLFEI